MTKTFALAAALTLFAATGAFAQASTDQPAAGSTMMKKGSAPKSDAAAIPKMHHKMAKNEAQMNEQEAETTRQLNQQQAQFAQNAK